MPPVVRSQGKELKVDVRKKRCGLNPLRGPSAALAAQGSIVAREDDDDKRER